MTDVMAQDFYARLLLPHPRWGGRTHRKERITMRENVLIAVVSVLVGLMVGYLAWGLRPSQGPWAAR
jgi:hypothetical protein